MLKLRIVCLIVVFELSVPSEPRNSFTDFSDIMSTMSTEYSNPTPGAGSTESDGLLMHDAGWNAVCEDIASMI